MPRYEAIYRCAVSHCMLTWHDVMRNCGVCPVCGVVTQGSTVVEHYRESGYWQLSNRPGVLGYLRWLFGIDTAVWIPHDVEKRHVG